MLRRVPLIAVAKRLGIPLTDVQAVFDSSACSTEADSAPPTPLSTSSPSGISSTLNGEKRCASLWVQ